MTDAQWYDDNPPQWVVERLELVSSHDRAINRLEDFMNSWCRHGYPSIVYAFKNASNDITGIIARLNSIERDIESLSNRVKELGEENNAS